MVQSSLNLVGDEGLDDLLEDVFDLEFSDDELRSITNVGAIYDVLSARFPTQPGFCATSVVFYRLRRALVEIGIDGALRPSSALPLSVGQQPRFHFALLSNALDLRLPATEFGPLGTTGCLLEHGLFWRNRDSQIGADLIHHPCWMEASMDDGSLFG